MHDFTPLDLNESNIQAIFRTCLAKQEDSDTEFYTLFRKDKRI